MTKNLINILEEYINSYEKSLPSQKYKEELDFLQNRIGFYDEAMKTTNSDKITLLELDEIDKIDFKDAAEKNSFKSIYNIEVANHIFGEDENTKTTKEQIKLVRNGFHSLYIYAQKRIKEIQTEINKENYNPESITAIRAIIEKLKNNIIPMDEEIIFLGDIINKLIPDISINDRYEINKLLTQYLLTEKKLINLDALEDDEENNEKVEENTVKLTDEELNTLFTKYGYNYSLVSNKSKEILKTYGNIDKMTNIFELIKQFKINDSYLMDTLPIILVFSTPKIIESIVKNIMTDNKQGLDINEVFNNYLAISPIFINGGKYGDQLNDEDEYIHNSLIYGSYKNYIKNRKFFIEKKQDINEIMSTCATVMTMNNQTLQDTYSKLKSYGLTDTQIMSKKSSLTMKDIYPAFDRLIELGLEDYYVNYPAKSVQLNIDNFLLCHVAKALDIPFINEKKQFKTKIGDMPIKKYVYDKAGINPGEESKLLDLYVPENAKKYEAYKSQVLDIISNPNTSITDNLFIKYLEDNYKMSDSLYNIKGILISRRKVLRIYETLYKTNDDKDSSDILFFAITCDSILTKRQALVLKNEAESIEKTVKQGRKQP